MSEIKHKYFASIATKYSLRIITFSTCFGQRGPSSGEHYTILLGYAEVQRYKTLKTSNLKLKTPYDEPDMSNKL
jgi:hypothetical protein